MSDSQETTLSAENFYKLFFDWVSDEDFKKNLQKFYEEIKDKPAGEVSKKELKNLFSLPNEEFSRLLESFVICHAIIPLNNNFSWNAPIIESTLNLLDPFTFYCDIKKHGFKALELNKEFVRRVNYILPFIEARSRRRYTKSELTKLFQICWGAKGEEEHFIYAAISANLLSKSGSKYRWYFSRVQSLIRSAGLKLIYTEIFDKFIS
ncbi:MAG: hypothetical protein ABIF92_01325, partial [archaeon]